MDEPRYPRRAVRILVENGEIVETLDGTEWRDLPGWIELRAYVERTGDLESGAIATVIDLERGLHALVSAHPEGAAVVALVMMLDLNGRDLQKIFGGRRNWPKVQERSIAWLAQWLSGGTFADCEHAWKTARTDVLPQ